MQGSEIVQFLSQFGYWIMLPLMIIEGPATTMVAALMAAAGVFNVYTVFLISLSGDIVGDLILYGAGRKWGMSFVRSFGKYLGISEKLVSKMEKYFIHHGGKTIFGVKCTTGLSWATFTAAGIAGMPMRKFILYSFLGGVVWSGLLVTVGYFFGFLWREVSQYIEYAGWIIGAMAVGVFLFITVYRKIWGYKMNPDNSDEKHG